MLEEKALKIKLVIFALLAGTMGVVHSVDNGSSASSGSAVEVKKVDTGSDVLKSKSEQSSWSLSSLAGAVSNWFKRVKSWLYSKLSSLFTTDYGQKKWDRYFKYNKFIGPNDLVKEFFEKGTLNEAPTTTVLDLGAGNGNDTIYLLNKGFTVYAVDLMKQSIESLDENIKTHVDPQNRKNAHLIQSSFQNLSWDKLPKFDAIVAINTIMFVAPADFKILWDHIVDHLKPGGVFVGRLVGDKEAPPTWDGVIETPLTMLSKEEVSTMVKGFDIIKNEEELDPPANHVFNLIIKKPDHTAESYDNK